MVRVHGVATSICNREINVKKQLALDRENRILKGFPLLEIEDTSKDDREKFDKEELRHDHILNFLGCLLGWLSFYYLIFQYFGGKSDIGIPEMILILVAYIGITGYLPHIIINRSFKP